MRRASILTLLVLTTGCRGDGGAPQRRHDDPGPPPTGGPCTYSDFAGECVLVALIDHAQGDQVTFHAGYAIPAHSPGAVAMPPAAHDPDDPRPAGDRPAVPPPAAEHGGDLRHRLTVPAHQAAAARAFLLEHARVPCKGQHIISGTCTPVVGELGLPPFAP